MNEEEEQGNIFDGIFQQEDQQSSTVINNKIFSTLDALNLIEISLEGPPVTQSQQPPENDSIETPKKQNYFIPLSSKTKNSDFLSINEIETSKPEDNDDDEVQRGPTDTESEEKNRNIQKTVNYFNHKFVISETEDISVDTLLSLNENNSTTTTTTTTNVKQPKAILKNSIQEISRRIVVNNSNPVNNNIPSLTLPPSNVSMATVTSTTTTANTNVKQPPPPPPPSILKRGESILKVMENVPKQQKSQVPETKRAFFVKNNSMNPIISSSDVSSGIFRSIHSTKRKSGVKVTGPTTTNGNNHQSPQNNIIISQSKHGKIIPVEKFVKRKQFLQQQQSKTATVLDQFPHILPKPSKTIGRHLIKIPVNKCNGNVNSQSITLEKGTPDAIDHHQRGDMMGNGTDENNGIAIPSNNLVLNIVNMVANSPEITQRTQVNQK